MSKHLSSHDIARIVDVIKAMKAPVTWERVEKALKRKLDLERSRWGLRENVEIKAAYDRRRDVSAYGVVGTTFSPIRDEKSSNMTVRLEKDNRALREQLAIILDNAVEMGVPLERMDRPPAVIDYGSTPGRRSARRSPKG